MSKLMTVTKCGDCPFFESTYGSMSGGFDNPDYQYCRIDKREISHSNKIRPGCKMKGEELRYKWEERK